MTHSQMPLELYNVWSFASQDWWTINSTNSICYKLLWVFQQYCYHLKEMCGCLLIRRFCWPKGVWWFTHHFTTSFYILIIPWLFFTWFSVLYFYWTNSFNPPSSQSFPYATEMGKKATSNISESLQFLLLSYLCKT